MNFAIFYSIMICICSTISLVIVFLSLKKKDKLGLLFSVSGFLIVIAAISYLISALHKDVNVVRVTANLYFGTISLILSTYVNLNSRFTKIKVNKIFRTFQIVIATYASIEFLAFISNIFYPWIIDLEPSDYGFAPYFVYQMHIPFFLHLTFSYLMIALITCQLVDAIKKTPGEYKRPYILVLIFLGNIVGVNLIFLFIPTTGIARFDISLLGYYILLILLYWTQYHYLTKGMTSSYKNIIVDNVEDGYILFNYEKIVVLANNPVKNMFPDIDFSKPITLDEFLKSSKIVLKESMNDGKPVIFQYRIKKNNETNTFRTSYRTLYDKKKLLGCLFYFSRTDTATDALTGFESYNAFLKLVHLKNNYFSRDSILTIFDIDSLSIINETRGYETGNEAIISLAKILKKYFPRNSYFVRGVEAELLVFTFESEVSNIIEIANRVKNEYKYNVEYSFNLIKETESLIEKINETKDTLNTKKIMDDNSSRSSALNSLVNALQEVDSDTLNHLRRTQELADLLGEKLELSEIQKANLSLLSVLHDIGKIAIPLEILNKPTKLTLDEINVLKSHVRKGYNIALASPHFKNIALEILHHHERWDGDGYPDGLSKESIPLLSRIVAIVDSFDAMISDRPYRKGMSVEEAIEEIIRCSGTQFDPFISSEFIEIIKEKEGIKLENIPKNVAKKEYKVLDEQLFSIYAKPRYTRYLVDNGLNITSAEKEFTEITGYTDEDIKNGLLQTDLIEKESRPGYIKTVTELMGKNNSCFLEHEIVRKDGSKIDVFCYGRKFFDSATRDFKDEIIVFDVTTSNLIANIKREEEEKASVRLASWEKIYRTDSLTGLLTHNAFKNDVTQNLLDKNKRFVFVMIDIDAFKMFNDSFGHVEGDKFLQFLTKILVSKKKHDLDIFARLGGDEFACLIALDDNDEISKVKSDLVETTRLLNDEIKEKYGSAVSISLGACFSDENHCTFEKLYEKADSALYKMKREGKSGITFYN